MPRRRTSARDEPFEVFNVATGDYITVTEIAELAIECSASTRAHVRFEYTGGDRGWKGDVPVVRLDTDRIRALGWKNERVVPAGAARLDAAMLDDATQGRFDA